ncbi:RNA polymerase sigma factor [Aurantimonas sp. A3-2-R12]|uniref:RNA polymerase sigma factor n=1 Tax=Aurantimonas sp. A3-2-R12 TaxID=3114362 RepID=UPI002E16BD25|nr:sigma-70 family RNA polymerase sigma factor [Aurantimonas sp. A3-2-R12]
MSADPKGLKRKAVMSSRRSKSAANQERLWKMVTSDHRILAPNVKPALPNDAQMPVMPVVAAALADHRGEFLRYLLRRLGDRDTAEDVLQNFCLRVIGSSGNLRKSESVIAYLYTVLRSVLTDYYRREAARRRREGSYVREQITLGENPDEIDLEDIPCECFRELLPALRPDYAEILRRVDLSDEPRENAVANLGIAPGNARVRLHRARRALREAMRECCGSCCEHGFNSCTCGDRHHSTGATETSQVAFS